MPPRLPARPDFGDALVAVSRQAKIALADFRLRPLTREQRIHLAHRRLISAEDLQRDNPPLDVGAQSGHFAHFNPLAFEHRNLSESEGLIGPPRARSDRLINGGLMLDRINRVREKSVDRRLARRPVFLQSCPTPMQRRLRPAWLT